MLFLFLLLFLFATKRLTTLNFVQLSKYFADVGFHIPARENTADFFLDIITPDNTSVEAAQERKKQVASLITRYQGRPFSYTSD
jgi:hypothetical protein